MSDKLKQLLHLLDEHLIETSRLTHYWEADFFGTPFEAKTVVFMAENLPVAVSASTFVDVGLEPIVSLVRVISLEDREWKEIPQESKL